MEKTSNIFYNNCKILQLIRYYNYFKSWMQCSKNS